MPPMRLSDDEALDLAVYLATLNGGEAEPVEPFDATDESNRWVELGRDAIEHYGCAACHQIPGFEDAARIGPELTDWAAKPVGELDFGTLRAELDDFDRTHGSFARHKLLDPRGFDRGKDKLPDAKLRMPNFSFTEEQADALVTFLLSRRPTPVAEPLRIDYDAGPIGAITRGRHLVRETQFAWAAIAPTPTAR